MNTLPIALLAMVISVGVLWIAGVAGRRRFHAHIARDGRKLLSKAGKGIGPEHLAALPEQLPQPFADIYNLLWRVTQLPYERCCSDMGVGFEPVRSSGGSQLKEKNTSLVASDSSAGSTPVD
jgi:hypothetical protein